MDPLPDAPRLGDLRARQRVEDQSSHLRNVTGRGGDDRVPAVVGQHRQRGPPALPPLLDIAPVLAPLAALGLVLMMIGAAITRGRR